ncbi:hypothetical protein I7107_004887 [Vibrio parahaemolyticus]|nr:hypothetical protein [Vibrio parahaemolyticus]EGQ9075215.1 hypothetical protein [Vibrio parahaemolyticus]
MQTTNFMCFDALKSGVVPKRLVIETTWKKQRRRKLTHNARSRFWKGNLTMRTFNKVTETTWN